MAPSLTPRRYVALVLGIVVASFGLVWIYTVHGRASFLDDDYGQWAAKMAMIERCDVGQVAVLGDSRASAAYVPRDLGLSAKNLALTGITPVEAYYETVRILRCPAPPGTVVLSFAPRQYGEINWLWEHAVRFGMLNFDDLQDIARTEQGLKGESRLYRGSFGSEPPAPVKNFLYAAHFPPFDFASLIAAARTGGRTARNRTTFQDTLAADGQHVVGPQGRCSPVPAWEASQVAFKSDPLVMDYLDRLLTLLLQRGIKVVLAVPPLSQQSMAAMKPGYVAGFQAFVASLLERHPGMTFSGPLLPSMQDCAFSDAHHLNQAGAEAFSRDFGAVLRATIDGRAARL